MCTDLNTKTTFLRPLRIISLCLTYLELDTFTFWVFKTVVFLVYSADTEVEVDTKEVGKDKEDKKDKKEEGVEAGNVKDVVKTGSNLKDDVEQGKENNCVKT